MTKQNHEHKHQQEHALTMSGEENAESSFLNNNVKNDSALQTNDAITRDHCNIPLLNGREVWNMFGYSIPKQEVVFFSQIIALYIVIIIGLVNVTLQSGDSNLWLSLLSASLGYLLPNPSLRKETMIIQRCS